MKRYSQADEETIRAKALVREWRSSGLLEASQAGRLESELGVNLRRTNSFFRAVLFLFTAVIVTASLWLIIAAFDLDDKLSKAVVYFGGAMACLALAEFGMHQFRLYRFGVEEALAAASAVLMGLAAVRIVPGQPAFAGLAAGAVCGVLLYLRFGYVYTAIAAMICVAALPFTMSLSGEVERILAAGILACAFIIVRPKRLLWGDEFPGGDYGVIQAAAWAGVYIALNLQFAFFSHFAQPFYWLTYLMIWLLPLLGFRLALLKKDRLFMNVNLAMALATLLTNKPYLGLPRQPWDPMLFGVLLTGSAMMIKRWLSHGHGGQRYGFTAARLLASDRRILAVASTASAAFQPQIPAPAATPTETDFGGGRSGGAGASGRF